MCYSYIPTPQTVTAKFLVLVVPDSVISAFRLRSVVAGLELPRLSCCVGLPV